MNLPKSIQDVVDAFASLPGIGPKTAQRLAFYMLRIPKDDLLRFSDSLKSLKEKTIICAKCFNVGDDNICDVCRNESRDQNTLCVIETPLDLIAIEKSGYKGLYHVLHGVLNPVAGIGPDEIFLNQLFPRLNNVDELIIATSTSLEGESTAMYIYREIKKQELQKVKVSRIGKGLPLGADIEYADERTLSDALLGRMVYSD